MGVLLERLSGIVKVFHIRVLQREFFELLEIRKTNQ